MKKEQKKPKSQKLAKILFALDAMHQKSIDKRTKGEKKK